MGSFVAGVLLFFGISSVIGDTETVLVYEQANDTAELKIEAPPPPPPTHIDTPDSVRAIYMSSWVTATPSIREKLVSFMEKSEVNSVVLDIKDYTGKVVFEMSSPQVEAMESSEHRVRDMREFINELHSKNIYVIGRVAVFQDPHATAKKPEFAVLSKNGGVWKDRKNLSFIDPGATEFWDYIVEIAKESERVGFDEINFDYIRYPTDGNMSLTVYPHMNGRERAEVLEDFFKYLNSSLADTPVTTSADLFGLTTWTEDDLRIGQVLERAAPHFDFIAPMVYPSHYEKGFQGFANPATHPYEVIKTSMERASFRLTAIGQDPQKLRAWIQDFDLGADYGITEIKAQKKAVYDAGLDSWMSWDPSNHYTQEAYFE